METPRIKKSRGSSSSRAREYRQKGHDDALLFALSIGVEKDYKNGPKAKKDVIDKSGDTHSVKGGDKKWQIFLYGRDRFENDPSFKVMNGMGQHLIDCINSFPPTFQEYEANKIDAKEKLRANMRAFADKLKDPMRLRAFISKSMFNGGEVDYLSILHNGKFHIFLGKEIEKLMSEKLVVENSQARQVGQYPEQKVVFKYGGVTLGEVEMRNDSIKHYREIRFNMMKPKAMKLLFENITKKLNFNDDVIVYGEAIKKFGRWAN